MALNKAGPLSYGAAAVLIFVLFAKDLHNALLWLHDYSGSTSMFGLALGGVALASLGPIALSLCCLHWARQARPKFAVHLIFILSACGMFQAGASLLDFADGRTGQEPANHAIMPGLLLLGLTIVVHGTALAMDALAAVRLRGGKVG
jgi:hypothetical protein